MQSPSRQKTMIALKKAQSLLGKILSMVEHDAYCIDVMQQNLAVIGLLKSVHQQLLEGHLRSCFMKAMESGSTTVKQRMIDEILKVTKIAGK
jgi:CsoR family transcriptional regulator, copper-sensing transcriptional repressor